MGESRLSGVQHRVLSQHVRQHRGRYPENLLHSPLSHLSHVPFLIFSPSFPLFLFLNVSDKGRARSNLHRPNLIFSVPASSPNLPKHSGQ